MARNFTRELRKALRPGVNRIVCSSAPYEGKEVEYAPRNAHDRSPWRIDGFGDSGFRFSGRECHVQTFRYAVVEDPKGLGFYVMDTKDGTAEFCGVKGVLAVAKLFTSRHAATDAAKRLEKDGPLAFAQEENRRTAGTRGPQ